MCLCLGAVIVDRGTGLQVGADGGGVADGGGPAVAVAAERVGDTPAAVSGLDGVGTEGDRGAGRRSFTIYI